MKIEHIALWTRNLETLKQFYVKYFHGIAGEKYHDKTTGFESYFVSFSFGTKLEIMQSN